MPRYTLAELAERLALTLDGDGDVTISGVGSLAHAAVGEISHLSSHRYLGLLPECRAGALLISPDDRHNWPGPALVTPNPYLAYARVTQLFARLPKLNAGRHASAVVDPSAEVHPNAQLGPNVVVGAGCRIDDGAQLFAGVSLGDECQVGADSRIMPNAVLYADVHIGARCVIHSGAILGGDGFGYTPDAQGQLVEIAQLGGVRIGDDVSIGAATSIDRGALDHTVVGHGVKIDNQVQIGHNCNIGAHTLICGCVGIVGSSRIGEHCVLAGGVGVGGDGPVDICGGVIVSGMTHVSKSISKPGVYSGGILHGPANQWKRNALRFQQLDSLARRISRLEKDAKDSG